ncbi:MAG TPA: FHA domain-containing protein [Pirellulales bacterium]
MEATLVVIGGKTNRSEIKLKLPSVFGRGREADITIAHPAVSRQHCRLEEVEGALVLRDNNSTNGVYFGKQRVKEMVIRPGDLFTIGPLTFRAEYDHDGEFPEIGEPRPEAQDEATIQFSPSDDLDFAAPTPPDGTPLPGTRAKKPPADDLDLGLGEPQEPAAKADSGIDFLSDAEPVAAAAEPEAAEPEADGADADDFMSAFQEDDPIGASASDAAEHAEDDPLADLGVAEPNDDLEKPAPAKQPAAKQPAAKEKAAPAASESADEMFSFESKESASDALGDDDALASDALGEVDEPAGAGASADDELDFDMLGSDGDVAGEADEDTTEMAASPLKAEKPSPRKPPPAPMADDDEPADSGEIEFDALDDLPEPAAKSAGGLDDLDDLDAGDTPAAPSRAEKDKATKGSSAKDAKGKHKPAKDKDAKKGWWPFGKNEKKPAKKSDERKPSRESPAAAELPDLEPAAASELELPEPAAADDDDMPDFFEAEAAPPVKADKPAKPAAKPASPQPAAAKTQPAESKAQPATKTQPPAAKTQPAAAKKAESHPAASHAKPAASKPVPSKPPADEPDLDFSGSGSASGKPAEDDDGLNDFFADLGL